MKTRIAAVVAGVAIGMGLMIGAGVVQAEKPSTPAPLHRHYFEAANGERVYVGPDVCDIPLNEQGWAAFHVKVHVGIAGVGLEMQRELCPDDDD